MQLTNAPSQLVLAFATGDTTKNTIPVPSQIPITPGAASYTDGFPPLTAQDPSAGGVGPAKADFNGILNALSAIDLWVSAGGVFVYNAAFQTAIGGYPKGAMLQQAAGGGLWISTVDNNLTDPDTGGAGWTSVAFGPRMTASVFASAQQTLAIGNSKVLFDTVEFDRAGLWDATHKRFAPTVAGNYRVTGSVELDAPSAQGPFVALILKNGAVVKECSLFVQISNTNMQMLYNAIIPCAVGDFLELAVAIPQTAVNCGFLGQSSQTVVYAQIEYLGT